MSLSAIEVVVPEGLPAVTVHEQTPYRARTAAKTWFVALTISAVCIGASLLRFGPLSIAAWHGEHRYYQNTRIDSVLAQKERPFDALDFNATPHIPNALIWRLLPPVLGNTLHLPARFYLLLPPFSAGLLVLFSAWYALRETDSLYLSAAIGLFVSTSSAFFVSAGVVGNFDALYLLALLTVFMARSDMVLWAACSLGPWCDERFLLILPAVLWLKSVSGASQSKILPAIYGIAPYVCLRLWATAQNDLTVTYQILNQRRFLSDYLASIPLGWWMGFRLGWVPVIFAIWSGMKVNQNAVLGAIILITGLTSITFFAWDLSRSIAVLLPFLIYGCCRLRHEKLLLGLAVGNFALPASHVILNLTIPM